MLYMVIINGVKTYVVLALFFYIHDGAKQLYYKRQAG
jgi:hypothetical protein